MAVYGKSLVDVPNDEGVHVKIAGVKGEKYGLFVKSSG